MRRISKSHQRAIDTAMDACRVATGELARAIDDYNAATASIRDRIEALLAKYNEKIAHLKAVYEDIARGASAYHQERSERWQASDAGRQYEEWIERLEEIEIEEAELEVPALELPDSTPDFTDDSWLPPETPGPTL